MVAQDTGHRVLLGGLELLDRQLLDRDGAMVGKVDDVELGRTDDGRVVVTALLSGSGALVPRFGRRAASWARSERLPCRRIPIELVAAVDDHVTVGGVDDDATGPRRDHPLLSELLRHRVLDAEGRMRGRIHEVRFVQDGPLLGYWGHAFRLDAAYVGRRAVLIRLGLSSGAVPSPRWLAALARRLAGGAELVPWPEVVLDG